MTQKEKDLLLKDLCARLPYGLKVKCENYPFPVTVLYAGGDNEVKFTESGGIEHICMIKPYLFPLSSMTEEQKNECFKGTPLEIDKYGGIAVKDDLYGGSLYTDLEIYLEVIVWLLKNHFDYIGLIPMGLAIDATGKGIY